MRELRELERYRAKLTALRTSANAQIHAVMAKVGILPPMSEMFGPGGQKLLDQMEFPGPYGLRVESLRDLLEIYDRELAMVERDIARWLKDDPGYHAIQSLHGIGRSPPRSWSLRSATYTDSRPPGICVRGRG